MIRDDRFVLSLRQFAVDLDSLELVGAGVRVDDAAPIWHGKIPAVWYRRRRSVTVACIGRLSTFVTGTAPADGREFLQGYSDGRYGGDCVARWDGESYWGVYGRPEAQAKHLELLKPMLASFPTLMPGYDGWWRFDA